MDGFQELKQRGNTAFRSGLYRDAIQLYTDALDAARSEGSSEDKRVLLSNRAQAYLQWGDIYNALRDTDLALSPEYTHTSPPSPASITRKCQWRKARVLNPLGRWMETQAALDEYTRLSSVMGEVRSAESVALEHILGRALRLPHDSEVVQRVELLRALNVRSQSRSPVHPASHPSAQARGIIVKEKYICTFPEPPFGVDEDYVDELKFETLPERPNPALPDPFLTPLAVPVYVRAPHFPHPTRGGRPLGTRVTVSEAPPDLVTIGNHVDSLLMSFLTFVAAPKGKAGTGVRRNLISLPAD
ncbi:hypothetical protein FA95DRAFT_1564307 [Auriscalpium vulgare]|uniref:Uncharacterized protein n=1 Tax=Auriscalpium vulgare TaxID=40419 RepID=A0ACB8RFN4_9AGAM|nr:hypothetical protein FA95DRAFT_1564307 [Auriscalpium vulgare]